MTRLAPVALGAVALAVLTACGGSSDSGSGSVEPQAGGTLRYALSQAPTCSDPAQSGSNQTIYVARQVVDSLTDQDPQTGELTPWLAQSWEVSPDATSFIFTLKDGVTFSDGTPVNAQAVKANFDAVVNTLGAAKAPLGASYLAGYVGTTVVDDSTARVEFSSPNAQFLQATSTPQLGLLAKSDTDKSPEERCSGSNIGSGPFVYASYQQDRAVTLKKRAGYSWGSVVFGHEGEAYLDSIEFTVVPESGVRTGSLASDQFDAISDALPQDEPQIAAAGGQILTTPNPGTPFGFLPNVTRPVLGDLEVRRALLPALDRQELVDTVLGPDFEPATGTLASKTPQYVQLDEITYDPDKSRAILDAAGWVPGPDGIREKNGRRLSFSVTFSAVFAGNQAILELVQQQLSAVGVDLQLDLVSNAEFTARQNSGDYDSTYGNSTRADGDILRTSFSLDGRNTNRRGPLPALDQALTQELATTDADDRKDVLADAQQLITDNGLLIPTIELSQAIGAGPKVHDLKFEASARLQFFDTWLD